MAELTDLRVAVIATDGFEEAELIEPAQALRNAGAEVLIVAPRRGEIQGFDNKRGVRVWLPRTLFSINPVR